MSTLERAIQIAAKAHEGQVDKAGAPYILHPLRMMLELTEMNERIVAFLHDVVEDSGVSLDALKSEGFSKDVLDAIDSLTRQSGETYETFVLRAAENPIGRRVKLADLEDNTDVSRIPRPTSRDYARVEKYRRAIEAIRAVDHENGYREPDMGLLGLLWVAMNMRQRTPLSNLRRESMRGPEVDPRPSYERAY